MAEVEEVVQAIGHPLIKVMASIQEKPFFFFCL